MLYDLTLILLFLLGTSAIDKTIQPETKGEDVTCVVIKKIDDAEIFPWDKKMLRRIAYVESRFGVDRATYRPGYHGGIWQIDEIVFEDAMKKGSHPNLDHLWLKIEHLLFKRKEDIKWEDLRKPLFSGVFARIKLYLIADDIPTPNELFEQAKYWKSYYNTERGMGTEDDFVNRVNRMDVMFGSDCNICHGRMNLVLVMDGSGSINIENYDYAKQAAQSLIDTFSNKSVDIGYVLFSETAEVIYPLKSNLNRDQMKKKISATQYPEQNTRTDLGIYEGTKILEKIDNHTGTPKVMVIFTDGIPDFEDLTKSAADEAKQSKITIFAIAIGDDIRQYNLIQMASRESYILPVASYIDLTQFTDKINSGTCSVPQTPAIGNKVKDDKLSRNEKRYFKFQVPSGGVTVKIHVTRGNTHGYYSYTIENPTSAINDGEFTRDVFIAPRMTRTHPLRAKRDVNNTDSVYVTMEGEEDSNVYSLETSEGNNTSGGDQLKISMLCCIITSVMLYINIF